MGEYPARQLKVQRLHGGGPFWHSVRTGWRVFRALSARQDVLLITGVPASLTEQLAVQFEQVAGRGEDAAGHHWHDRVGASTAYVETCWRCAEEWTAYMHQHPDELPQHPVVLAIPPEDR